MADGCNYHDHCAECPSRGQSCCIMVERIRLQGVAEGQKRSEPHADRLERDSLRADVERLRARVTELERENTALRGITPDPDPGAFGDDAMPRYGLRWSGPTTPLSVPMADGYWTPWHLAQKRVTELEAVVAAFMREHDDDGPDSEFGSSACECESCAQAREALAGGGDAAERLLASQTRAAELEAVLLTVMKRSSLGLDGLEYTDAPIGRDVFEAAAALLCRDTEPAPAPPEEDDDEDPPAPAPNPNQCRARDANGFQCMKLRDHDGEHDSLIGGPWATRTMRAGEVSHG